MACNTEEKGEFLLPSSAVVPLRRALVEAENSQRALAQKAAAALHAHITQPDANGKKPRLSALNKILRENSYSTRSRAIDFLGSAFDQIDGKLEGRFGAYHSYSSPKFPNSSRAQAIELVLPYAKEHGEQLRFQAPKKKDLPPMAASTTHFSGDEWSLSIDPKTRMVRWKVARNNRSTEIAWEEPVPKAFDRELSRIKWTRGTGGHIRYRDEHMEDAAMDHGVDSVSLTRCLGPLGDQAQAARSGLPTSFFKKARQSRPGGFRR